MTELHHFENELLMLKADISKMLSLVLESYEMSIESLETYNIKLAKRVLLLDDNIDDLNRNIEESVYQIIARYNPLAKNLRYAMTMAKFSSNLERIGDLSCNIAQKTIKFSNENIKCELTEEIRKIIGISLQMIKDTFKAFGEKNIELAIKTWKTDNKIDDLEKLIYNDVFKKIKSKELNEELIVPFILITRDIERIADHCTNLCEEIVYIETSKELTTFL
ncbi:phosphate transport system regulatory protein PhoU [Tepiditoga spiralis]|uniref:Phosphate-specific transport system accessory protein PhoU n=1 Tax=Tepiditoga spiralis TaxID=2108365 RepID=A0A7G1G5B6_9BACT|nr:phosphate signaling complex protein PhoU [Tepiditoga spiralis]BBE31591.1 phosphate transport system regulatory protein PhoU [Tepiditoga spiralis]